MFSLSFAVVGLQRFALFHVKVNFIRIKSCVCGRMLIP